MLIRQMLLIGLICIATALTACGKLKTVDSEQVAYSDAQLRKEIEDLKVLLNEYIAQQIAISGQVGSMQTQINNMLVQLAELESQDSIVEYIDPCGDGVGYDEIILKTSNGNLIAYFESSGNRFLSILIPGNYRTTDQSKCYFTVDTNGQIINQYY